jgi:hypothetical protein
MKTPLSESIANWKYYKNLMKWKPPHFIDVNIPLNPEYDSQGKLTAKSAQRNRSKFKNILAYLHETSGRFYIDNIYVGGEYITISFEREKDAVYFQLFL